ncbi:MAG: rhomboid family intramembrane serine protease [Lunatimonas sp.]|uniref:rhomboid family intramembrane serine protease n=1 Tax=Lunatimonas sp. TaxID=2060141 RepID=UPI00263AD0B8|nr:rhomboid family intramembrane serine protease [Lunatimonas sp.]MCC5938505.1 rhomboid family intramembrane serine protease [Lunatimonas sp.]
MELSLTFLLIALTCLSSYYAWKTPSFLNASMFTPYRVKHRGEYGRFLLSGFIHKDGVHLLFNMFTFYFFGQVVEQFLGYMFGPGLGAVMFVGFYLVAIVVSDIPTYWKEKDNPHYHALGASGGTAAMVFASIVLMPLADICIFGIFCLPGFILGFLFLGYAIYKGKQGDDNINHDAHLFGALFGIIFVLVISPSQGLYFWDQIKSFRLF